MKKGIKVILLSTMVVSFSGCGGGSSSSDKIKVSPAPITKNSATEATQNLIIDPIDFRKVRYQETGKSLNQKFLKASSYDCGKGGNLIIERTIDKFSVNNFLDSRENILTYTECKTDAGEFFNGKIELKYTPRFPEDIELSQITEENAIELSDKNLSILEDYTYENSSYKIDIKKGSKFESALDESKIYKNEKLTISAFKDEKGYKIDSLNTRVYSKDNIKKVCYKSGRVYINSNLNYFDIKEDDSCVNEFVWVDGKLQAGGEVDLIGENESVLKLIATDQNQITAYLNGEELDIVVDDNSVE